VEGSWVVAGEQRSRVVGLSARPGAELRPTLQQGASCATLRHMSRDTKRGARNEQAEWKVAPHGPIEQLEHNLWRVEGDVPGGKLKRVMAIGKLANGDLVVHNAIALEEALMREIDAWGRVAFIVVPNGYHRLDCARFKGRYPDAKVVCPSAAAKRVGEVAKVDLSYANFAEGSDVTLRHLAGTKENEGIMIVKHGTTSTVVFNDLVFNMPHVGGTIGWILRYVTKSSGSPTISLISRMLVVKDKAAVAKELRDLAALPGLSRLIVSHHQTISNKPAELLEHLASTLAPAPKHLTS
jgi:hypothetical protein